jgi:hypothetical protein
MKPRCLMTINIRRNALRLLRPTCSIDVKPGREAMQQARVQRYTLTLTIR